jgi:hypothetical protein
MNKQELKPNLRRHYRADSFIHGAMLEFPVDGHSDLSDADWEEIAADELNFMVRDDREWVIVQYGDETELEEN